MQIILITIAIISFIISSIGLLVNLGFDPLLGFLTSLAALLVYVAARKPKETTEGIDQRNRRVMLDHVENFWVKGILEKSLHGAALLELGIKEDPHAVNYPWTIKKESTNEILPAGKSILEIFREVGAGRSLLMLGTPGSGKSTMLYELARQLVACARTDESEPIPVVFNLASWKEKQTLTDWLAEQLNLIYFVPKQAAPTWIEKNFMLLLLDGLDEVKEESRAKCVETINQFRKNYGFTSLVVCSRIDEYAAIDSKLSLEGAIVLQPLTARQITAYFDPFGKRLAPLKQLLRKDNSLRELVQSPLMLSIMTLIYKDGRAEELASLHSIEEQRRHIFETYIQRMFERSNRSANLPFPKPQVLHYLGFLARCMRKNNVIAYQIESTQPFWLEKKVHWFLYQLPMVAIFSLTTGTLGYLYGWVTKAFGVGVFVKLGLGSLVPWISVLLFLSITLPYIVVLEPNIEMVDIVKWSREAIPVGFLIGIFIGTGSTFLITFVLRVKMGLSIALYIWLLAIVMGLLLAVVTNAKSEISVKETTRPMQRLQETIGNATLFLLLLTLLASVAPRISAGWEAWLHFGIVPRLTMGLTVSLTLIILMMQGVIKHYILRMVLHREGLLPWHIVAFLDSATDLIFLRRVGGSYIFVHRLLMDHFAEMDT